MTAVGKILVFFNLLFSVAVGALTVMNFNARTYWVKGYDEMKARTEIGEASRKAYEVQNKTLVDERQTLNTKLVELVGKDVEIKDPAEAGTRIAAAIQSSLTTIREQKDALRDVTQARAKAELELAKVEVAKKVALEDVKRRQADVEKVRETLRAETERNTQLVKEKTELRDQSVAATIQATSLKEANRALEQSLREMAGVVARLQANKGGSATAGKNSNPPPDNVEGQVKRVDANSRLLTISLGSDSGISKGHTLNVFRLEPRAVWLCNVQVVEVTNNQAVAQILGKPTGSIQVGDRVGSQILR